MIVSSTVLPTGAMPSSAHDDRLCRNAARRALIDPLPTFLKYSAVGCGCGEKFSLACSSIRFDNRIRCFITVGTPSFSLAVPFTILAHEIGVLIFPVSRDAFAVVAFWSGLFMLPFTILLSRFSVFTMVSGENN